LAQVGKLLGASPRAEVTPLAPGRPHGAAAVRSAHRQTTPALTPEQKEYQEKNFRLVKEFHQMHRIIINITQNGRHSVTYLYGFTVSAQW
jgi:hypothetical protein